ncbi:MAG: hypothetical protein R3E99_09240 [Burkholderiaceae bacterium]
MSNNTSTRFSRPGRPETDTRLPYWLLVALLCLMAIGFFGRLAPLADLDGRLFWQYMSEDGYLMQTVARNMAIGLGMSTAEGTIATNGVQPLATYLFAGLHWLSGGDKTQGIVLVTVMSAFVALAGAWLLAKVGGQVFRDLPHGRALAWTTAALWFTAPLITRHSMNGLETGLYQAAILLVMNFYLERFCGGTQPSGRARIWLGVLLGLAFLSRNDAVFFIAALLLVHLLVPVVREGETLRRRLVDGLVAGTVSIVVASPWLVNNYLGFGSVVPISGTAQSFGAAVGRNLPWLPAHFFENMWLWFPIPAVLERQPLVQVVCVLAIAAVFLGYWFMLGRHTVSRRRHFLTGLLFSGALATYYGLFFGANWFLPRYLSAASPFLWLFVTGGAYALFTHLAGRASWQPLAVRVVVGVFVLTALGWSANDYRKGTHHMHRQVVEWTQDNVAPDIWVAAPQTGTLGYFHDRTINLDGKVNPIALRRLIEDGHSLNYVLESPAQYIVDWVGMAKWVTYKHLNPRFGEVFRVRVEDHEHNLAVLERIAGAR